MESYEEPPVAFGGQYRFAMPVRLRRARMTRKVCHPMLPYGISFLGSASLLTQTRYQESGFFAKHTTAVVRPFFLFMIAVILSFPYPR